MPTFEEPFPAESRKPQDHALLAAIKAALPELERLLEVARDDGNTEELVYRFYHQSWKVYPIQELTQAIVDALRSVSPTGRLTPVFEDIVAAGTGREFSLDVNQRWSAETRPLVEAFFHARYFLAQACRYGRELETVPTVLPYGWAALLELYDIR
jgi:hypothetical protein